jgi:hypothetical protein
MSAPANPESNDWLTPWRFALLLALCAFASFPQIFLGSQTFVYRDFGYFTYPAASFARECFQRGEFPLWNPYNCCGIPFLAQWNTAALYPPSLIYLTLPLSWSLGVFQVLHLVFGGLGMFFLARRWTNNSFAAAVAGVVFAFNGLSANCLMWVSNLAVLAWMPWVVWRVEIAVREGGRQIAVAALVGAMQMLAGAPELIFLTWLVALIPVFSAGVKGLMRLAFVVALVVCLAAAQLLPFVDFLSHSHRVEIAGGDSWSMPLTGWGNFLAPLLHEHPAYHGVFIQTGQQWTSSYYVGVATLALAALAVWRWREKKVLWLAALALLGLALALGNVLGLYGWLRHVPGLGVMRYPIKFVVLPVFILPLLAAFALADDGDETKTSRRTGIIWFALLALTLGVLWFAHKSPLPEDDWMAACRNAVVRVIYFSVILAGLVFVKTIQRVKAQHVFQFVLLIFIWLDLLTHAPRQHTIARENLALLPRASTVPHLGEGRVMISPAAMARLEHSAIADPTQDFLSRRWTLLQNCNLLESIPKVDGFYSLHLREEVEVSAQLLDNTNGYPERLADFLGVTLVSSPTDIFDWTTRSTALPLMTAGQKPVLADAAATLQHLASPHFDPQNEVLLPREAESSISTASCASVKIFAANFSAHRVSANFEASAPTFIVVAQSFHHNWRAYVDGKPAKLWRANHNFQAVEVPAGAHKIKLSYVDRQFYFGLAISLAALLACAVIILLPQRKTLAE